MPAEKTGMGNQVQPYDQSSTGMPTVQLRMDAVPQIQQNYSDTLVAATPKTIALLGLTGGTGPGTAPSAGAFTQGMSLAQVMNLLGLNITAPSDLIQLNLVIRRTTTINTVETVAFDLLAYNTMNAYQTSKYTVPCNVLVRPGEMCYLIATSTGGGAILIQGVCKSIDC